MFFRPGDGNKRRRQQTKPPKKRNKPGWTDKQRAQFAREHYARHHGSCTPPDTSPTTTTPPKILGHHQNNNNDVDFNTTITPIKFDFPRLLPRSQPQSTTRSQHSLSMTFPFCTICFFLFVLFCFILLSVSLCIFVFECTSMSRNLFNKKDRPSVDLKIHEVNLFFAK